MWLHAKANGSVVSRESEPSSLRIRFPSVLCFPGGLPPSLPSFALDAPAQIQISPGHPDLLYLIQAATVLPKAFGNSVTRTNLVRLIQFDGSTFTVLGEVSLP